uniref:Cytochrome P450 2J2-like n=1 Tax=Scleropages formosus TaxID=113540 RepID=A0A8C9SZX7_SCLFO
MTATMSVLFFSGWLDLSSVLIFLFVFLILVDLIKNKAPKNFPPGPPWSLPFVGDLFRIDSNRIHLQMFAKQYGNIFSIRIGQRIVVLNGLQLVKEALVEHGENFAVRPTVPLSEDITLDKGLVASGGYQWKQQRRFALSTLRNFGLGKKSLESQIQVECRFLNDVIDKSQGQPFEPISVVNNAVANIISCLVFGDRFDYSNSYFQRLLKLMNEAIYLEGSIWAQLYNMFPWLMRRLPGPHKKIFSHWAIVIDFVKLKIKEHKEDWDPSTPRDYIDRIAGVCFNTCFNEDNLCSCTLDLFAAGTETTSATLNWALLYMIKYPEIQEKVQAEIDKVLGPSHPATMADRANMPYTDAVIHEIQRMGNIIPLNVPRMAVKDTTIGGYTIPKGTMVMGTLQSVLFDESEWEAPFTFNPGHFLDEEGKFKRRDAFLPFSAGSRMCLGEPLARMELFLFFTSLLQQFTFFSPPGVEPTLEFKIGFTLQPKGYKLCAVPR